jgi:hypothetical protein
VTANELPLVIQVRLIPVGAFGTLHVPPPPLPINSNVAVIVSLAAGNVIGFCVQLDPNDDDHLTNRYPLLGVAVNLTDVPGA